MSEENVEIVRRMQDARREPPGQGLAGKSDVDCIEGMIWDFFTEIRSDGRWIV
jgi:hypothetical protein